MDSGREEEMSGGEAVSTVSEMASEGQAQGNEPCPAEMPPTGGASGPSEPVSLPLAVTEQPMEGAASAFDSPPPEQMKASSDSSPPGDSASDIGKETKRGKRSSSRSSNSSGRWGGFSLARLQRLKSRTLKPKPTDVQEQSSSQSTEHEEKPLIAAGSSRREAAIGGYNSEHDVAKEVPISVAKKRPRSLSAFGERRRSRLRNVFSRRKPKQTPKPARPRHLSRSSSIDEEDPLLETDLAGQSSRDLLCQPSRKKRARGKQIFPKLPKSFAKPTKGAKKELPRSTSEASPASRDAKDSTSQGGDRPPTRTASRATINPAGQSAGGAPQIKKNPADIPKLDLSRFREERRIREETLLALAKRAAEEEEEEEEEDSDYEDENRSADDTAKETAGTQRTASEKRKHFRSTDRRSSRVRSRVSSRTASETERLDRDKDKEASAPITTSGLPGKLLERFGRKKQFSIRKLGLFESRRSKKKRMDSASPRDSETDEEESTFAELAAKETSGKLQLGGDGEGKKPLGLVKMALLGARVMAAEEKLAQMRPGLIEQKATEEAPEQPRPLFAKKKQFGAPKLDLSNKRTELAEKEDDKDSPSFMSELLKQSSVPKEDLPLVEETPVKPSVGFGKKKQFGAPKLDLSNKRTELVAEKEEDNDTPSFMSDLLKQSAVPEESLPLAEEAPAKSRVCFGKKKQFGPPKLDLSKKCLEIAPEKVDAPESPSFMSEFLDQSLVTKKGLPLRGTGSFFGQPKRQVSRSGLRAKRLSGSRRDEGVAASAPSQAPRTGPGYRRDITDLDKKAGFGRNRPLYDPKLNLTKLASAAASAEEKAGEPVREASVEHDETVVETCQAAEAPFPEVPQGIAARKWKKPLRLLGLQQAPPGYFDEAKAASEDEKANEPVCELSVEHDETAVETQQAAEAAVQEVPTGIAGRKLKKPLRLLGLQQAPPGYLDEAKVVSDPEPVGRSGGWGALGALLKDKGTDRKPLLPLRPQVSPTPSEEPTEGEAAGGTTSSKPTMVALMQMLFSKKPEGSGERAAKAPGRVRRAASKWRQRKGAIPLAKGKVGGGGEAEGPPGPAVAKPSRGPPRRPLVRDMSIDLSDEDEDSVANIDHVSELSLPPSTDQSLIDSESDPELGSPPRSDPASDAETKPALSAAERREQFDMTRRFSWTLSLDTNTSRTWDDPRVRELGGISKRMEIKKKKIFFPYPQLGDLSKCDAVRTRHFVVSAIKYKGLERIMDDLRAKVVIIDHLIIHGMPICPPEYIMNLCQFIPRVTIECLKDESLCTGHMKLAYNDWRLARQKILESLDAHPYDPHCHFRHLDIVNVTHNDLIDDIMLYQTLVDFVRKTNRFILNGSGLFLLSWHRTIPGSYEHSDNTLWLHGGSLSIPTMTLTCFIVERLTNNHVTVAMNFLVKELELSPQLEVLFRRWLKVETLERLWLGHACVDEEISRSFKTKILNIVHCNPAIKQFEILPRRYHKNHLTWLYERIAMHDLLRHIEVAGIVCTTRVHFELLKQMLFNSNNLRLLKVTVYDLRRRMFRTGDVTAALHFVKGIHRRKADVRVEVLT